jgi:hypothetical protein
MGSILASQRPLELPDEMLDKALEQLSDAAAIAAYLAKGAHREKQSERLRKASQVFEEMRTEITCRSG